MSEIRVRFAPSPTGKLHIGGARTALFNFLFARQHQGKFLLRIEDTDLERSTTENVNFILEGLKFLKIDWDEEPVFQSSRIDRHRNSAFNLLQQGHAYHCFCLPEKLEIERKEAIAKGSAYKYPGHCRNLSQSIIDKYLQEGKKSALRFKVQGENISFTDGVHGQITTSCAEIEDFVILRRDGTPTYMLAVVVDDIDMRITDIIRGDDHISNTPKQILLHQALGNIPPNFAHVPLILGPDKKRLSKRHGALSVLEYQQMSILSHPLTNYIALLGWSPGDDREIMTEEQLINAFSLNKISPKPAVFDVEKLLWFNSQFIANMPLDDLLNETLFWLNNYGKNHLFNNVDEEYISQVLALSKTRLRTISDLFTDFKYYFQHPTDYDEKGVIKYFGLPDLADKFSALYSDFESLSDFKAGNLENLLRSRCDCWKISAADMIHPLRLALTGLTVSPGLFELMEVLGKERVLYRINKVIEYLNSINKTQNCK